MSDEVSQPAPAPPARRRRTGLIIGGLAAAVLLLAGGVAAFVLLRPADSPEAALDKYLEANTSGDFEGMLAVACERSRQYYDEENPDPAMVTANVDATWEIREVEQIDENSVAVTFSFQFEGYRQFIFRYLMVREDGAWKVCGKAPD